MNNTYILGRISSLFVSFKIEDTMKFFQEVAFLLLPLLAVGQIPFDEVTMKFLHLASCELSMFHF